MSVIRLVRSPSKEVSLARSGGNPRLHGRKKRRPIIYSRFAVAIKRLKRAEAMRNMSTGLRRVVLQKNRGIIKRANWQNIGRSVL